LQLAGHPTRSRRSVLFVVRSGMAESADAAASRTFAEAAEQAVSTRECHGAFEHDHFKLLDALRTEHGLALHSRRGAPLRRLGWQAHVLTVSLANAARERSAKAKLAGRPEQVGPFFRQAAHAREKALLERARAEGLAVAGVAFGDDALEEATQSLTLTELPVHETTAQQGTMWDTGTEAKESTGASSSRAASAHF